MEHLNNIKIEKKEKKTNPVSGLLNALFKETSYGTTENGADTFTRSGSPLLDFYAQAGAMRANPNKALNLFKAAFAENREKAIKILFYLRDIRRGQGERTLFRNCLGYLGQNHKDVFDKIIKYVPMYGRWDDMFFNDPACFAIIKDQLSKDASSASPSLLAKWLPTINASSNKTRGKAKIMAKALELTEIGYRRTLRMIRKRIRAVEEFMSDNRWKEINYSEVPSQAARIYKDAFKKHDEARYNEFIEKATKGEVKINAGTLYPHQIYKSVMSNYSNALEALWNQLPDYTQGKNALVVADTSRSMDGDPMAVSISLALYFAERNKGQFKDHFISFSTQPKLHRITGETLEERMNSVDLGLCENTDLQAVFDLLLDTAIKNSTPVEEMPSTIYIISDMEFDRCTHGQDVYTRYGFTSTPARKTNYELIEEKYREAGYTKPNIVFWNVRASGENLPVQIGEGGVAMISGLSPVIFKIAVENKTPEQVMEDTINSERYQAITIS